MTKPTSWCTTDQCPCCGKAQLRHAFASNDHFFSRSELYDYKECPCCLALIMFPQNGKWNPDIAYPDSYPAHDAQRLSWHHRLFASYCFPMIGRQPMKPIWEVGAGTGRFLAYLSERHCDVFGIEINSKAVECAQRMSRNVTLSSWESFNPAAGSVGTLIMNHVIEHLVMPPEMVFEKAARILKNGGHWCICTPNAASWGRFRFGSEWHPLETPRHTIIYTPDSIRALSEKTGLRVQTMKFKGRSYDLTQSVKYMKRLQHVNFINQMLSGSTPFSVPARALAFLLNLLGRGDAFEIILEKN